VAKKQIDLLMTKKVWWILEKDCRLIDHFGSLNEVLELCRISKGHTKLYHGIYNTQSEVTQEIEKYSNKKYWILLNEDLEKDSYYIEYDNIENILARIRHTSRTDDCFTLWDGPFDSDIEASEKVKKYKKEDEELGLC